MMNDKLEQLQKYLEKMEQFNHVNTLLYWDMRTNTPKEGFAGHSDALTYFSTEQFSMSTSDELKTLLDTLAEPEEFEKLDEIYEISLRQYKKVKKEEKLKLINKYLKQFELSDMLNKKVYQLSGGEQQRIAIIKLILQGSQVILADEPTSGLDKENELIVMKLLKELNEKGITIIMVTHNMNLCDCFSRVINVENFR